MSLIPNFTAGISASAKSVADVKLLKEAVLFLFIVHTKQLFISAPVIITRCLWLLISMKTQSILMSAAGGIMRITSSKALFKTAICILSRSDIHCLHEISNQNKFIKSLFQSKKAFIFENYF